MLFSGLKYFRLTVGLTTLLALSLSLPSLANLNGRRTSYRVGILRHADHAQAQAMYSMALSFVNNLGGTVELVPFFINASNTQNTPVEAAMYHEANELCGKLCGIGADLDSRNLVALLTVASHPLVYGIATEIGLPIFTASTLPSKYAPKAPPNPLFTQSIPPNRFTTPKPATSVTATLATSLASLATRAASLVTAPFSAESTQLTTTQPPEQKASQFVSGIAPPIRYLGPDLLSPMFSFLIRQQWLTFVYVAEGKDSLERYQMLKDRLDRWSNVVNRFRIYLICLDQVSHSPMLFHGTKYLPTEDSIVVDKFILDMSTEKKYDMLLMELKDLGMAAAPYQFYIANFIITELDLTGFDKGGATLYGYQLVSPLTPLYRSVMRYWYGSGQTATLPSPPFFGAATRPTPEDGSEQPLLSGSEALVFDQVFYLKTLLETLSNNETTQQLLEPPSMQRLSKCGENFVPQSCSPSFLSPLRESDEMLAELLDDFRADGLTGWVKFDNEGRRRDYLLNLMELSLDQPLRVIGTLRDDGEWVDGGRDKSGDAKKVVTIILNVTTIDSPPFLFVRNRTSGGRATTTPAVSAVKRYVLNDDEFEGFCVDLADEIGRLLNVKFNFRHVADGQYGAPDPVSKRWNGMIGELIRGEAHVAIAPLTITSTRERVVQMTKPILNTGISIMIKKPEKQQPGVFSFLEPLSSAIWVCTLFAYCGTAVCMWILCRLNNGEMVTPFRNSFWSALCALLGLGGEFSPKSFSGRLLATVWYFFCLILISSYTANMTAFLTVERLEVPIESAEDLVRQDRIQYGTLDSGSTKGFFQTSVNPLYRRMWEVMNETQPSVFVKNVKDGVERVRNSGGRYAFLLESVMNAYYNQRRPCNTMQVGPLLDSKGYGIVTPLGSPYHDDLNYAVLYLKEIGIVQQLVTKWWYDKGECPQDNTKQQDVSGALRLNNVTGVFFILIGGLVLGISFSMIEFAVAAVGLSRRTKVGFPVAARELLSGCILGSANKTIRPLHSLDLLARVLPWVEMPNFSATMLLNRLDAISPHDPRRKYVAAACLRKYCQPDSGQFSSTMPRDQTASSNLTARTASTVAGRTLALLKRQQEEYEQNNIPSQSQQELFHHRRALAAEQQQQQILSRSHTLPHMWAASYPHQGPVLEQPNTTSDTSSSVSTSSPNVISRGPIKYPTGRSVRNRRSRMLKQRGSTSASSSTTEEERLVREVVTLRSPSYIDPPTAIQHPNGPPLLRMPETLQLRPVSNVTTYQMAMHGRYASSSSSQQQFSLYEMLTNQQQNSAAVVSHLQRSGDRTQQNFEQNRWYPYDDHDLTNL